MKKIILIALSAFVMSCTGIIGNGFKISGEIKGLADGTNVFLEKQNSSAAAGGPITIDTVQVKNGKFTFEGKAEEPEIHSIRFDKTQGGFIVVVEKGNINVIINKDSIQNAKVSGTFNNDELVKYNAEMMKIQKRMMAFQNTNMSVMQTASEKKDTVVINKLRKEYTAFQEEFTTTNYKYIENNPKSFLSVLLVEGMFNDPQANFEKIKKYYSALDADIKATKPGKNIETKLDAEKKNLKK
ncbi:DUF4369 domain-containing protein [Flavobacterium psychrophilum]|uniref:DUF4369 domain-containing protein n=1 Tax=Flavobacterium psychrophilum TaxID=96345 RepID=UPI001D07A12A|nr:DUF4369 domain-containing protein [Flavobacterium psychrophilum]MCB6061484.1 DUF4369 domain-containing protein [Flavobacterium psychrophilum]